MKLLTLLFGPVFDLFISLYRKVCAIRKDDTPAQENALFLMLLVLTVMVVVGMIWISLRFPEWGGE